MIESAAIVGTSGASLPIDGAMVVGAAVAIHAHADARAGMAELWRFAQGTETPAELRELRRAVRSFFRFEGQIPLTRILHMPASHAGFRKATRNEYLVQAAKLVHVPPGASGVDRLYCVWQVFVTRGPWREWRDDAEPPQDASDLQSALFYATRYTAERDGSRYLDARQLRRIVGHIFIEKCHATRLTI